MKHIKLTALITACITIGTASLLANTEVPTKTIPPLTVLPRPLTRPTKNPRKTLSDLKEQIDEHQLKIELYESRIARDKGLKDLYENDIKELQKELAVGAIAGELQSHIDFLKKNIKERKEMIKKIKSNRLRWKIELKKYQIELNALEQKMRAAQIKPLPV